MKKGAPTRSRVVPTPIGTCNALWYACASSTTHEVKKQRALGSSSIELDKVRASGYVFSVAMSDIRTPSVIDSCNWPSIKLNTS